MTIDVVFPMERGMGQ